MSYRATKVSSYDTVPSATMLRVRILITLLLDIGGQVLHSLMTVQIGQKCEYKNCQKVQSSQSFITFEQSFMQKDIQTNLLQCALVHAFIDMFSGLGQQLRGDISPEYLKLEIYQQKITDIIGQYNHKQKKKQLKTYSASTSSTFCRFRSLLWHFRSLSLVVIEK